MSYRNTCEILGELKKAVETLACSACSHSISRSPKLLLVFPLSFMVHAFYFLNTNVLNIQFSCTGMFNIAKQKNRPMILIGG